MEEIHAGQKLLLGVRSDIKILLTNFEKTASIRFQDFCKEWQQMNFSLIYRERKQLPELLEFCEEIFHIAKGYLAPPWKFHTRVGALYLLYGLYFKQPIRNVVKIRFTKNEWKDLCQLIQSCKENKHHDIVFIHYKLYAQGAYVFTILPRAAGMERGFRKYEEKCKINKNPVNDILLQNTKIIDPDLLTSLSSMEKLYCETKAEVLGKRNLEFVDKDFADGLKTKIEKFYDSIRVKIFNPITESTSDIFPEKDIGSGSKTTATKHDSSSKKDSIAERRRKIRTKAVKSKVNTSPSKRRGKKVSEPKEVPKKTVAVRKRKRSKKSSESIEVSEAHSSPPEKNVSHSLPVL